MSDYYGDKVYGYVSAEVTNWPSMSEEELKKRMRFEAAKAGFPQFLRSCERWDDAVGYAVKYADKLLAELERTETK